MRIEPVFLFDLDGTLVDSVYQHVLAWKEALDTEGIELSRVAYSSQDRHERRIVH
jgi:beta-phosphoglucomutase-like phosphatase (HAD superfamily)